MGVKSILSISLIAVLLIGVISFDDAFADKDTNKDEKKIQKAEDKIDKTEEKYCKKIQKIADKLTKKGLTLSVSIQTTLDKCSEDGGLDAIIEELMNQIALFESQILDDIFIILKRYTIHCTEPVIE